MLFIHCRIGVLQHQQWADLLLRRFPPGRRVEAVLGQLRLGVLLQRARGEGLLGREALGMLHHQIPAVGLLDRILEGFKRTLPTRCTRAWAGAEAGAKGAAEGLLPV